MKTYTLVSVINGWVDHEENRPIIKDKIAAMTALTLSNDKSALLVSGCKQGEISGYRKIDGKISVFSVEGEPMLNLLLLCGPSIISPIEETHGDYTVKISSHKIYKTLVDALNIIAKHT